MQARIVSLRGISVLLVVVLFLGLARVQSAKALNQVPANVVVCDICSTNYLNSTPHIDPLLTPQGPGPYPGGYEGTSTQLGYVQRVLANEWLQSWDQKSLRAGAIAVRTFGMYHVGRGFKLRGSDGIVYSAIPASVQGFGVNNPPADSVKTAVNFNRGHFISYYTDSGNNAISCLYRQDSGNWTENWESDCWPDQPAYLCYANYSVHDPVRTMHYNPASTGHLPAPGEAGNGTRANPGGPGMGQYGSQQWAQGSFAWGAYRILAHYYRGVIFQGATHPDPRYRWLDLTADPMNNDDGQPWNRVPRTMNSGQTDRFRMHLQNAGTMRWARFTDLEPNIVAMSYHWLYSDGSCCVVWDGLRSYLPATPSFYNNPNTNYVPPGMRVYMWVNVRAPSSPGSYIIQFDMVQEGVTWFNQQGGWLTVKVPVTVQ